MLEIYIYGYLNRVQSSRRLERECQRNIELIWLTGQLAPDFKTIADFRKDNGKAIRETCRAFVALCGKLNLLADASVAIDGSKFKAVNARDKNFTEAKMKRRLERIDESIARYLSQLETADRHGDAVPPEKIARLKEKVAKLKEEIVRLNAINEQMIASKEKQISLTDPDARSMATSGKDTGIVGYNVQSAVDTTHHLIVAHEVTNVGTDRSALADTAELARVEMGADELEVVADRGYYSGEEILACELSGITVTLPKPMTSAAKGEGRFGKQDFVYVAADDEYRCPAGQRLTFRYEGVQDGKMLRRYWRVEGRLRSMPLEGQMHARAATTDQAVDTRGDARARPGPARPQSRCDARAPLDGRASVRNDQSLDGRDALSVLLTAEGGSRDGAVRARLQHEARDRHSRRYGIDRGHAGLSMFFVAPSRRQIGLHGLYKRPRNRFPRPKPQLPRKWRPPDQQRPTPARFHTAWAKTDRC